MMASTHTEGDNEGQHEFKAALRVFSDSLGAAELRSLLGEPTRGHDLGDPVGRRGGVRKSANWTLESWILSTRPLHEHVEMLVDFAESKRDVLEMMRPRCLSLDVFCGVFANQDAQGGWTFDVDLLRRLSELQLPVLFDLYGSAGAE